jgi:hypothetical protein
MTPCPIACVLCALLGSCAESEPLILTDTNIAVSAIRREFRSERLHQVPEARVVEHPRAASQ